MTLRKRFEIIYMIFVLAKTVFLKIDVLSLIYGTNIKMSKTAATKETT